MFIYNSGKLENPLWGCETSRVSVKNVLNNLLYET